MTNQSRTPKVYLIRAGSNGEEEDFVLENNLAVVGFHDVPSLEDAKDYDEVARIVSESYPDAKPRAAGNFAGQLWCFALDIQEGDIVVLPRKLTSQIAMGRVAGPYRYQDVNNEPRHTRPVEWLLSDLPRTTFRQDLLYSFGAALTVCNISRNEAVQRVQAVLRDGRDPGLQAQLRSLSESDSQFQDESDILSDLAQSAHDQIVREIQTSFSGHALTRLVDAVLRADGWVTSVSSPGPDGGADILGGRGPLGLDPPLLCVQVKSQDSPTDVTTYRTLQGTMQSFKAEQGLLVCWGGFTRSVLQESRQAHFTVRLWDSSDLVGAIYRTYESLPPEIQAELPLKRVWMLVPDIPDEPAQ